MIRNTRPAPNSKGWCRHRIGKVAAPGLNDVARGGLRRLRWHIRCYYPLFFLEFLSGTLQTSPLWWTIPVPTVGKYRIENSHNIGRLKCRSRTAAPDYRPAGDEFPLGFLDRDGRGENPANEIPPGLGICLGKTNEFTSVDYSKCRN
jgi:hypothetical protein